MDKHRRFGGARRAARRSRSRREAAADTIARLAIVLRIANSLFRDQSVDETFVQDLRAAGVPEG
jgi:hypothetical protein